jgi:hypothetical protein
MLLMMNVSRAGVLLDFEEFDPPMNGVLSLGTTISTKGFTFVTAVPDISFFAVDPGWPNTPNSGSNTLIVNGPGDEILELSENSGSAFDLISFRAAEGRNTTTGFFWASAHSIRLDGVRMDGSLVTLTLDFDLIAEEDPTVDFQSFSTPGFTRLLSLCITGLNGEESNSFSLDDIEVRISTVPEPTTLAMAGITLPPLLGLGLCRSRKLSESGVM